MIRNLLRDKAITDFKRSCVDVRDAAKLTYDRKEFIKFNRLLKSVEFTHIEGLKTIFRYTEF